MALSIPLVWGVMMAGMQSSIEAQRLAMDANVLDRGDWGFHATHDPLTRFLRDRRLLFGLSKLRQRGVLDPANQSALVVCAGVGGEGILLRRYGFQDVTISDLSGEALNMSRQLDPTLKTAQANAENMVEIPDASYDLVVVQDGLHHLPRPVLGFTEMLRVARRAVIVIEPAESLVGTLIGTEWEEHGEAVNYVFRWSGSTLKQATLSYLLRSGATVLPYRLWDHNVAVSKMAKRFPKHWRLPVAKGIYRVLTPVNGLGNMMVGVVILGNAIGGPRKNSDG
ncbi:class I SAM-dependent methyltransferase [Streptomyces yaanensis]|uniref:Class I SAM-dependent methyltransferase n=1 Tax=Streptomyces yaanensis TaxID=1142239 RepID=A0ABV7SA41_9ACTN|nr:class I SAM-dependent methyltransferase [Streptomyces sp. CGMCC 4.7035]WNB96741.1 class I SAM-dependent methyltransferase [Streptomyces sp. CGMCC 4.7035]